jgi:hypothetical protein
VEVPTFRALRLLEGTPEELVARARTLSWTEPMPPLVHARARTDSWDPLLWNRLEEALAAHAEGQRPLLVDLRLLRVGDRGVETPAAPVDLQELQPSEVFGALCASRGLTGGPAHEQAGLDKLRAAFAALLAARGTSPADLFQQMAGDLP